MKFKLITSLLLIIFANLSSSENYEDYSDEEGYFEPKTINDSLISTSHTEILHNHVSSPSSSTASSTTTTALPTVYEFSTASALSTLCPAECSCINSTFFVDCSNRQLKHIPKNLPSDMWSLDLSNNSLEELQIGDFENCDSLRVINLADNLINSIEEQTFDNLKHLEMLVLDNNKLSSLDQNVFYKVKSLRTLSINRNPLVLDMNDFQSEYGFLNQPELESLSLDGCNLLHIPSNMFSGLSHLLNLSIADNPVSEYIGSNIFKPLNKLQMLRMPNISKLSVADICIVLESIDLIFFDGYNVSCFVLVSGSSSYEDSIITLPPPVTTQAPTSPAPKTTTERTTITTTTTTSDPISTVFSSVTDPVIVPAKVTYNNSTNHNTDNETVNDTTNGSNMQMSSAFDLSNETIKYMLIGIIGIAVFGLLIGMICRCDVCGIKTRFCRTKKRRPTPGDHVSPAEEIPLNKVTSVA